MSKPLFTIFPTFADASHSEQIYNNFSSQYSVNKAQLALSVLLSIVKKNLSILWRVCGLINFLFILALIFDI